MSDVRTISLRGDLSLLAAAQCRSMQAAQYCGLTMRGVMRTGLNRRMPWMSLSFSAQERQACQKRQSMFATWAEFTANDAIALQQIANDPAIQIRKLDDSILQALGKLSGDVLSKPAARTTCRGGSTTASSSSERRPSAGRRSERAFLNARALPYPFGG